MRPRTARRLRVNQPKTSALSNNRLGGFSVECLPHFLNALGRDIEIIIRRRLRHRKSAKIQITAAQPRGPQELGSALEQRTTPSGGS